MTTKDCILLVGIVLTVAMATSTMLLLDPPVKGIDNFIGGYISFLILTWGVGLFIFMCFKFIIWFINTFRHDNDLNN